MASGILRITLALIVVVHHLSRLGIGKACVFIFFVLSGYWVARMWNDKYRRCENPWRSFVVARFLRLWPLFVLANLAGTLVLSALDHPVRLPCGEGYGVLECGHAIVANSVMLGYTTTPTPVIPPAWSLDIELQFYLVAPLLVGRLRGSKGLWLAAATLPLALVACYLLPDTLPKFLPFFLFGVLVANGQVRVGPRLLHASGWATTTLLLLSFATEAGRDIVLTGAHPGPWARYNEAYNALIAVLVAPFAVHLASQERHGRGAALGDIAFAIYIVHAIPVAIVSILWGALPAAQRLPYVIGAVLVTIGAALLLWRFVDRPMERWRRSLLVPRAPVIVRGVSRL